MHAQRLTIGTYVSGVAHVGLLGWLIVGWGLSSDPLPFEITEVSVVSSAEYLALTQAFTPQPVEDAPVLASPEVAQDTPPEPQQDSAPVTQTQPAAPTAPAEETPPPAAPEPVPAPAEVQPEAPAQPFVPDVPEVGAPDLPVSTRPVPRPADRIAETPAPPPPPEADTAPVETPPVAERSEPDQAETTAEAETAAPEAAAPRLVTEAETPSGSTNTSLRPQLRPTPPARPTPAATQTTETQTAASTQPAETPQTETAPTPSDDQADAIAAAVAAAAATPTPSSAPQGPPLTGGEIEGFKLEINRCWNFDPAGLSANVEVTVAFNLTENGMVEGNDVRLIGSQGGEGASVQAAFDAARRAVLRCAIENGGYDLPVEKYSEWQEVNAIFDSSGVRF